MSGRLRHRITFQTPNREPNTIGEVVENWEDVKTVWAAIEPLRGKTYFDARQSTADVDGKIMIRYMHIEPFWRILWTDWEGTEKVFKIVSVIQPKHRGFWTEVLYKEDLD